MPLSGPQALAHSRNAEYQLLNVTGDMPSWPGTRPGFMQIHLTT